MKRFVSAFILSFLTAPLAFANTIFIDVPEDHWAYEYLSEDSRLIKSGAIDVANKHFRCDEYVNRAEAAKILALTFGVYDENAIDGFPDIKDNDWFASYVGSLKNEGIVSGYSNGTFGPENYVSRAEITKMLFFFFDAAKDYLDKNGISAFELDEELTFSDVQEDAWYYPYVMIFVAGNFLEGYPDGTLGPDKPVTRCELAKLAESSYQSTLVYEQLVEIFMQAFVMSIEKLLESEDEAEIIEFLQEGQDEGKLDQMWEVLEQYERQDLIEQLEPYTTELQSL